MTVNWAGEIPPHRLEQRFGQVGVLRTDVQPDRSVCPCFSPAHRLPSRDGRRPKVSHCATPARWGQSNSEGDQNSMRRILKKGLRRLHATFPGATQPAGSSQHGRRRSSVP